MDWVSIALVRRCQKRKTISSANRFVIGNALIPDSDNHVFLFQRVESNGRHVTLPKVIY